MVIPEEIVDVFDEMFRSAQTKLIGPSLAYTVIRLFTETHRTTMTGSEIRQRYPAAVCELVRYVGHNLHLGARFDSAYISREDRGIVKHGILKPIGNKRYRLADPYPKYASDLAVWIPRRVKQFLDTRLGQVIKLANPHERLSFAENEDKFLELLRERMNAKDAGTSFEIACFAILKIYLEKFACRIYRDTRTFAHEGGTDLSTDFGAVYQIKKLQVTHRSEVDRLYSEIQTNFDAERIRDGKVIVVIDDITPECKSYLLKKNSLKYFQCADLLEIASLIREPEDRQKVLRIIYDEFCREYANDICSARNCDGHNCKVLP